MFSRARPALSFVWALAASLLVSCSRPGPDSPDGSLDALVDARRDILLVDTCCPGPTPVYVTFFSHNEEAGYWERLVTDRDAYVAYREDLVRKVRLLADRGAVLDWQSDHFVLEAMKKWETGELLQSTGGKNVLQWMVEDMGMSVDPHGHLTEYNYADLARLISDLGVSPSGVVGGFKLLSCGPREGELLYEDFVQVLGIQPDGTIRGNVFPDAVWKPEILVQGAMGGHWYDEFSSGVWRPCSPEAFTEHCPDGSLVYVGQGYPQDRLNQGPTLESGAEVLAEAGAYVRELVSKLEAGELPPGIYTASVHLRDEPSLDDLPSTYDGLAAFLDAIQVLVDRGAVVYASYEEVARIWAERYGEEPNRVTLESFSFYSDLWAQLTEHCWGSGCSETGCQSGQVCDPAQDRCVPDCRQTGNCPPSRPHCDQATGLCRP